MNDSCPDELMHQFLETLDKRADERQEACIHCGAVWYAIHHKDGVCHNCQREGKIGRAALEQHRTLVDRITLVISSILLIVVLGLFYLVNMRER